MIEKELALKIKARALTAIAELDMIVADARGYCSQEEFEAIRRGAGFSIARIIDELLEPVYRQYPEVDEDLKQL